MGHRPSQHITSVYNLAGWNPVTQNRLARLVETAQKGGCKLLNINGFTLDTAEVQHFLNQRNRKQK